MSAFRDTFEKARFSFVYLHPFFASLFSNLNVVEVDEEFFGGRTLYGGVDGANLYIIRENLNKRSVQEVVWFLAHETLHLMFDHINRLGSHEPQKYNIAADYVINRILELEKIGVRIPDVYYSEDYDGMTAEEVYKLLPDMPQGGGGGMGGDVMPGNKKLPPGASTKKFSADDIKGMIARASQTAQKCGKVPGSLAHLIKEIMDPSLPWEILLRRWFNAKIKFKSAWNHPNKNYMAHGLVVPSKTRTEGLDEIVIIVDVSGSIGEADHQAYANEMGGVADLVRPRKIHVLYWDTSLVEYQQVKNPRDMKYKAKSGGGTDIVSAIMYAREHFRKAQCIVCLSDLYTGWHTVPPKAHNVLWVSTTSEVAPFGTTIRLKT